MMIYMLHTGDDIKLYSLVPILSNTLSIEYSFETEELLIHRFTQKHGEVEIREFENPIDALMDAGHWLHVRDIRKYHSEVNNFLNHARIPSLSSSDVEHIEYTQEHDAYMIRLYDHAIHDAELSGYPLWIADQYYGFNLKNK